MAWLALAAAILLEVMATLSLRTLAGGWQPLPAILVTVGYLGAFVLMMLALRQLRVGAVYAIWSGAGTAGVAILAALLYDERLTLPAIGGIALIIAGVILLNLSGVAHG